MTNKIIFKIALTLLISSISSTVSYANSRLNVETHTKEEIRTYLIDNIDENQPITYLENPSLIPPYSTGKLSEQTQVSALKSLNAMRYIAGLNYDIKLKEEYIDYAQTASLVNSINDIMTHTPMKPKGMNNELYMKGLRGAGESNISTNYNTINQSIVSGYMEDDERDNLENVGHRRWCLDPQMEYTGFGSVQGHSTMYAVDSVNSNKNKHDKSILEKISSHLSKEEYTVVWPAQLMPTDYFDVNDPWSISMDQYIDKEKVEVELINKNTNQVWHFNSDKSDGYFEVNNESYGQKGCIIFRPDEIVDEYGTTPTFKDGDKFSIYIKGNFKSISYDVEFFDIVPIKDVSIKEDKVNIDISQNTYVNSIVYPQNATNNEAIKWTSSNEDVATVDEYGNIYTISEGATTITIQTPNGKSDSCKINVLNEDDDCKVSHNHKECDKETDNIHSKDCKY